MIQLKVGWRYATLQRWFSEGLKSRSCLSTLHTYLSLATIEREQVD